MHNMAQSLEYTWNAWGRPHNNLKPLLGGVTEGLRQEYNVADVSSRLRPRFRQVIRRGPPLPGCGRPAAAPVAPAAPVSRILPSSARLAPLECAEDSVVADDVGLDAVGAQVLLSPE